MSIIPPRTLKSPGAATIDVRAQLAEASCAPQLRE
ncbi:hypothetical protein CGLO_14684 [Colletotrichum gloeosporioides Cg-14]|uniref:Uncharacterized protein n=1 Tax=Colletotrichum gloeosporioides (strain Cg-14) TaxID=1237896 RepID=T0JT39_COLGC|nr:hypothetical protein CGLO_14684 [Colletotrichum gloeosporioides Cg-14]